MSVAATVASSTLPVRTSTPELTARTMTSRTPATRTLATVTLAGVLLLAGCNAQPAAQPVASPTIAAAATPAAGPTIAPAPTTARRVSAVLDGVTLSLEVAETAAERSVGLMGRTAVPAGTGMVFRFDAPSTDRFYMFQVAIPLRAVFIRSGRVVSSVVMPPCGLADPTACPTFGADGPYDTVVETDPATLPDVQPGDTFALL